MMECNNQCKTNRCCKQIVYFLMNKDEVEWAKVRGLEVLPYEDVWGAIIPSVCPHLKDGFCDIHETKPKICKEYKCDLE